MRVLLTTALGPYAEQYFNTSPTDIANQRLSRGCDIFTLGGHLHMSALHVIAQNISPPTVVLEYPRREDYLAELGKGYDYLGISSFHNQVETVIEMCRIARRAAPRTKIVLGGYGAVGIENCLTSEERKQLCDHLCHEEGVRFFRRLLGEDPGAPFVQSHLPQYGLTIPWLNRHEVGQIPVVIASVGCPTGCDFCGTTEMFQQRRIELLSPEQVHAEFQRAWRANPHTPYLALFEEDSFLNKEYMAELGRLLREDEEFGLASYNFICLASNRALSRWDWDEVMLCGTSSVFIGVESKFASEEGYQKREGRPIQETFRELHRRGVMTTGAWMVGFDFQNPNNIEEDLAQFVSLEPTTQQLARVCPFPGTKMWRDVKEEGRIREDVRWEEISFFGGGGMAPQHFTEEQIMALIDEGYKRLYRTWGPSIARTIKVNLQGYEYCASRNESWPYAERAKFHKKTAMRLQPLLKAMEVYAPNNIVRKRMKDLQREYSRLLGEPTKFQHALGRGLLVACGLRRFLDTFYPHDNVLKEEPFKRYVYHKRHRPNEKPYQTEYPRRTWRFKSHRLAQTGLSAFLNGASTLMNVYEQVRGRPFDEEMKSGNPLEFMFGSR